jgi:hypothetical protein
MGLFGFRREFLNQRHAQPGLRGGWLGDAAKKREPGDQREIGHMEYRFKLNKVARAVKKMPHFVDFPVTESVFLWLSRFNWIRVQIQSGCRQTSHVGSRSAF